jgi:hypothetical protein
LQLAPLQAQNGASTPPALAPFLQETPAERSRKCPQEHLPLRSIEHLPLGVP